MSSSSSPLSFQDWKRSTVQYSVRSWSDPEKPLKVSIQGEDSTFRYTGDVDLHGSEEILYQVEETGDGEKYLRIQIHSVEELVENTLLSEREAELYILNKERGHTLKDASEKMDVSYGTAKKMMSRIREKLKDAENTAKLDIEVKKTGKSGCSG